MTLPTLAIKVDWENNGVFTDSGDDITADTKRLAYRRGASFDGASESAGSCTLTLRNEDNRYSPDNAAGPHYGNLKIARSVWITATYGGTTYPVFYGHIRRITPLGDRQAEVYAEDCLSRFARVETNVVISTTRSFRDFRDLILDDMAMDVGQRDLAYGIENDIPPTYADARDGLAVLSDLNTATGTTHYIAPSATSGVYGKYRTLDRTALLQAASAETWDDTNIVGFDGYDTTDEAIVNEQRVVPGEYAVEDYTWTYPALPVSVAAGATTTVWASFSDPITSGSLAYTAATGSPTVTPTYFGQSAKIEIAAGGSDVILSEISISGRALAAKDGESVVVWDDASQYSYGVHRGSPVNSSFLISRAAASGLAEWIVARYATPKPRPRLTRTLDYASLLAREVGEVITLNFARLSIASKRYFIRALDGTVDAESGTWQVTYDLEEALPLDTWFTLDVSGKGLDGIGTEGKLAY